MKIVIAGLPKTGTTALFYKIKDSMSNKELRCLFEPRIYIPEETDLKNDVISKILFLPLKTEQELSSWKNFDKKILIIRDPRDRIVSAFLYSIRHSNFIKDKKKVESLMKILKQKEKKPSSVSMISLYKIRKELNSETFNIDDFRKMIKSHLELLIDFHNKNKSYFLIKYEDFIDGNLSNLEKYLSFSIKGSSNVPNRFKRVVRTKSYGDWKNWFTQEDIDFFKPIFKEYIKKYKYDQKWETNEKQIIDSKYSSNYVKFIISEKINEDKKNNKNSNAIKDVESNKKSLNEKLKKYSKLISIFKSLFK